MRFGIKPESSAFNFKDYNENNLGNEKADEIASNVMGIGINVIRTVATGIAIIMLSYIGIKYMMAAPGERADFKKSAVIYIVGAVLVFAAGNILTVIVEFVSNNMPS